MLKETYGNQRPGNQIAMLLFSRVIAVQSEDTESEMDQSGTLTTSANLSRQTSTSSASNQDLDQETGVNIFILAGHEAMQLWPHNKLTLCDHCYQQNLGALQWITVDWRAFMAWIESYLWGIGFFYWKPFISSFELKYIFWESEFFTTYGVSICFMTRIFRGKITQKIQGLYKEILWEILPRKIWVMTQIETP